jgi:2'-5' RNA ligase
MRIFFGIAFPEIIKEQLKKEAAVCQEYCEKGRFMQEENFHLTLRFIGEVEPGMVETFQQVLEETAAKVAPFQIHLTGLGRFSKRGGDILFRGLRRERGLGGLVRHLDRAFKSKGFPVEKMPFRPHVTLARRVYWAQGFETVQREVKLDDLEIDIKQIVIMESVRVKGELIYRPITHANLNKQTEE